MSKTRLAAILLRGAFYPNSVAFDFAFWLARGLVRRLVGLFFLRVCEEGFGRIRPMREGCLPSRPELQFWTVRSRRGAADAHRGDSLQSRQPCRRMQ